METTDEDHRRRASRPAAAAANRRPRPTGLCDVENVLELTRIRLAAPAHWTRGAAATRANREATCEVREPATSWDLAGAIEWAAAILTAVPKHGKAGGLAARTAATLTHEAGLEIERAARTLAVPRSSESLTKLNDRLDHKTVCQILDAAVETASNRRGDG